nr:hypothetical protein [Tanacetum cinerariifolium]
VVFLMFCRRNVALSKEKVKDLQVS